MKVALLVCLLAIAYVRCLPLAKKNNQRRLVSLKSCLKRPNDDDAVENLFKNKKAVSIATSFECKQLMGTGMIDKSSQVRLFNPSGESCTVGIASSKPLSQTEISVYSGRKPDLRACGSGRDAKAFFLPWDDNKNTYMILDSDKARWFFTNDLSGCDMFIATKPGEDKKPLLIHGNLNSCPNNHAENFRLKGVASDRIIRDFAPPGYTLRVRVHMVRPSSGELTRYWADYRRDHPGVQIFTYNIERPKLQEFVFYGYHDSSRWRFYLKGKRNGVITNIPVTL